VFFVPPGKASRKHLEISRKALTFKARGNMYYGQEKMKARRC